MTTQGYHDYLRSRHQVRGEGFDPLWLPGFLYDFQAELVDWSVRMGRAALFADCGLGKTPMQLVWAENVVRHTNRPVLILTPLAVGYQLVEEGEKFDVGVTRIRGGGSPRHAGIFTTNYEQLHKFSPDEFAGVVCDESSILKNFSGVRRSEITEFMRRVPYRLLCTATAAPNDFTELGTSSEALGGLGHMDMLTRYFRNDNKVGADSRGGRMFGKATQWRLKGHAEDHFWRWVCGWARSIRKPSDYGYDDDGFVLPPLTTNEHVVEASRLRDGLLFNLPAISLAEQREERRNTLDDRCEWAANLVDHNEPALVWCHLNTEGDRLSRLIEGAVQVSGSDSDEQKEEKLHSFAGGEIRTLITKPKIGAWGLNLQHCAHAVTFVSHSYEQYYQSVRRCWRFGQQRPVTVDVVMSDGERRVMDSLQRKSEQADRMFELLLHFMQDAMAHKEQPYESTHTAELEAPVWL
jgi:hypothetical protein